jgi:anti-sigma factor RsiW
MACDTWREKVDLYLDGELPAADASALNVHMRTCADCAADALGRVQLKRAVAVAAGSRYQPSAQLRAKVQSKIAASVATKPARVGVNWWWRIAVPLVAVVVVAVAIGLHERNAQTARQNTYSELADLHVSTLASATPFDVISTDRHTVKPWFQGRIPFTFNLPELQGSDFTLLGARVSYLDQSPGAHLIYQLRKHEISVFIFQNPGSDSNATSQPAPIHALSFNMESWTQDGLRYFVVGDVGQSDIEALAKLLRGAA